MMFGFDPDEVSIEPKEIDGTVYVPFHADGKHGEVSYFLPYEDLQEMIGEEDSMGTDDFRYDP